MHCKDRDTSCAYALGGVIVAAEAAYDPATTDPYMRLWAPHSNLGCSQIQRDHMLQIRLSKIQLTLGAPPLSRGNRMVISRTSRNGLTKAFPTISTISRGY